MSELIITSQWTVSESELTEKFTRSSGPGGQGVNTSDSRVELFFDVAGSPGMPAHLRGRVLSRLAGQLNGGVLRVVASEHRAQRANRKTARERLGAILREAAAPPGPPRRPTKPTRGSQRRRLDAKTRRGRLKAQRRGTTD